MGIIFLMEYLLLCVGEGIQKIPSYLDPLWTMKIKNHFLLLSQLRGHLLCVISC